MPFTKLLSLFLTISLILEQPCFAQVAQTLDISGYLSQTHNTIIPQDKFRPLHLRYISYDSQANDFKILLDKGDYFKSQVTGHKSQVKEEDVLKETTQELMRYFFIGLALPNDKFWVNLRPDSPDNIIDDDVAMTDIGRIFLEADVQLKKDTAGFTSPQTPEGKEYWDKLYQRAEELYGTENITIPTLTRPWIVPDEVIIRESPEGVYIYKATLKVMLEEDYLKSNQKPEYRNQIYSFSDPRLKELNEYSTQLIKETIIPKLTKEINSAKRYAPLRQVYYSLILAQWFKQKYQGRFLDGSNATERTVPTIAQLIDSGNLTSNHQLLTSQSPYSKDDYFQQYQKSFKDGEYNHREFKYASGGQMVRTYVSGGLGWQSLPASSSITSSGKQIKFFQLSSYILAATVFISSFFTPQAGAYNVRIEYDDNNVPKSELVFTEHDEDAGRALREIIEEISQEGDMRLSRKETDELIQSVEKDNPGMLKKQWGPGEILDITELPQKALFKAIMNRAKVLATQKADLNDREVTIYYVKSNILRMLQINAIANQDEKVIMVDVDNVALEIKSMLNGEGAYNPDFDFIRGYSIKDSPAEKIEPHIRLLVKHENLHLEYGGLIEKGKMSKRLADMVSSLPKEIRNRIADEILAYVGSGDTRQTLSFMLGFAYDKSEGMSSRYIYRQAGRILSEALLTELGYGEFLLGGLPVEYNLSKKEGPMPGKKNTFLYIRHLEEFLEKIPPESFNKAGETLFNSLLPGNKVREPQDIIPPEEVRGYIAEQIEKTSSPLSNHEDLAVKSFPLSGSAVIDEKIQRCIDKMAKVIFDQEAGESENVFLLKNISPGVTIEKLAGGNRKNPAYKLSAGSEGAVVKFFNLKQTGKRVDFDAEAKGLQIGKGVPLFQQYIDIKEYTDMSVGCIVTEFIPGKSFSSGDKYKSWDLLEYQNRQGEYVAKLTPEIENIPLEHWEQLVEIYLNADEKGITPDVNPENFKYHPERGFVALDYYRRGSDLGFSHYSVEDDVVEIVTGIKEHMLGIDNKLVKFIKKKIAEAKKAVNKKIKKGGIDLSRINKSMRTESAASSGFGAGDSLVDADFDVNEDLVQLQKLLNAQIIPSADRLNRYARAACASSLSSPESRDSALSLMAETFRLQEEMAVPAPLELKDLAAWLEQGG